MSRYYCWWTGGRKGNKLKSKSGLKLDVIPHAPTGRRLATIAEKDLEDWRDLLDEEYPMMTPEDISRADQSFHMLLLHDMIAAGDSGAAQEIHTLLRKEDREKLRCRKVMVSLRDQHEKLLYLAETLKTCYRKAALGEPVVAIELKKKLAEDAVKSGDTWLARHFLLSCLTLCRQLSDTYEEQGEDFSKWSKMQAELHCMLAFLARESNETLENVLALAIDHLAICRRMSKGQPWQFKPRVITIRLKRPIAIHGLRFEESEIYDVVDGCSMSMYMIATLLEHELLISLANQIMHSHRAPTDDDLKVAHEFADHALKLALEVRQPTAMSSAYVRFGLVLRHSGAYDDALTYFNELSRIAVVTSDFLTEGVAYHNIGLCLIGCHNSKKALEAFAKQLDIATSNEVKDLEADAMYELGHLFLQEGYLWEAEECYTISYEDFKSLTHTTSHSLVAWGMLGVAAGHKTWGRFANLCRHNRPSDWYNILGWKSSRAALRTNHRPSYKPIPISKQYPNYVKKMQAAPLPSTLDSEFEDLDAELSSDSFHENESRAKYDENYKKVSKTLELAGSKTDIRGSGELPGSGSKPDIRASLGGTEKTPSGHNLRGSWEEDEEEEGEGDSEEEEEDEEEDEEETEMDASQLEVDDEDYVDPDPDELPGYTRFRIKRVSSSPMIGPEMFIKVRPPSIVPEVTSDELLKDLELQQGAELKGKSGKRKKRFSGEDYGEGYDEWGGEDSDSDDDDDDDLDKIREWVGEGYGEWGGEDGENPTPDNTENTVTEKRRSTPLRMSFDVEKLLMVRPSTVPEPDEDEPDPRDGSNEEAPRASTASTAPKKKSGEQDKDKQWSDWSKL